LATHEAPAVRRAQILEAALSCFGEKGLHASKIDDIVAASGLSKGAIYWHFKSKDDIFLALFDVFDAAIVAEWEQIESGGALPTLERFGDVVFSRVLAAPAQVHQQQPLMQVNPNTPVPPPAAQGRGMPTPGRIKPRSKQWRVRGAVQIMGVFLAVAPVVAILPPHAPWPIGALAVGGILARRRFSEDCTLVSLAGAECPKCGTAMTSKQTRLRAPHAINCEGCHHQSTLKVPKESLTSSN
jgi:AcrR family transcriptional regulator